MTPPSRVRRRGHAGPDQALPITPGALPLVALVGRPNVGKSTLFNRLTGQRRAIVSPQPGLTRDRIYGRVEWGGRTFGLVDTAGLDRVVRDGPELDLPANTQAQAQAAIEQADVICLLIDQREGITAADLEVVDQLRRAPQPVLLVANKSEGRPDSLELNDLYRLGLGDPVPVSAISGVGTGDLLDLLLARLPLAAEEEAPQGEMVRCAIVGRPNVGKSSILNSLLGQDRSLVSAVSGTTRDPVDTWLETEEGPLLLVDTAGIRRPGVTKDVEFYSLVRALRAVERADVAMVVVDAQKPFLAQDRHIAGQAREAGAATLVVLNKWDLLDHDERSDRALLRELRAAYDFAPGTPFLYVSALTGRGLQRVVPAIFSLARARAARIPTPELNGAFGAMMERRPPPSGKSGRRLRLYYATQARSQVPTFVLFVNDPELLHFSYSRYLENQLRQRFGFAGVPIRLLTRKSTGSG
ncbi:MAG: ribosome biogenesis GTPase Der [Candidatus Dormibacteraeota bacterium]|nr:ribosome biogenesis GTPase Der [Candidatus Dormibacteraeota bacterium]